MKGEFDLIREVCSVLGRGGHPGVLVGTGDDAAVLHSLGGSMVLSVDDSVEAVHFRRDWLSPWEIGYRSFQAALSDLAAMGARPVAALAAISRSLAWTDEELIQLAEGQAQAAQETACPLIGGNFSRGDSLRIATTVVGEAQQPLLRRGACPGDELWLSGVPGWAAAGLCLLQRGTAARNGDEERAIDRWRRPRAHLATGRALVGRATAALDLSDGLAQDAGHLAEASGVELVLDADALQRLMGPGLLALARKLSIPWKEWGLAGGEDYLLLASGPAAARPVGVTPIGMVRAGSGVWLQEGKRMIPCDSGFDHFRA